MCTCKQATTVSQSVANRAKVAGMQKQPSVVGGGAKKSGDLSQNGSFRERKREKIEKSKLNPSWKYVLSSYTN